MKADLLHHGTLRAAISAAVTSCRTGNADKHFFQHAPTSDYQYEGEMVYVDTVDLAGRPLRRYKRV